MTAQPEPYNGRNQTVDETPWPAPPRRWYHKLLGLLAAIFCFEIGVFLVVFPWLDYWDHNYLAWLDPAWHNVWVSNYFRGAISGVGLVNICISFVEVLRLRRFSPAGEGSR